MPCAYCGKSFRLYPHKDQMTKDHIYPRSRFFFPVPTPGTISAKWINNKVTACRGCNLSKKNLTLDEWLVRLEKGKDRRVERVRKIRQQFSHLDHHVKERGDAQE